MRLRLTPRARDDLVDIADYLGLRNPTAARRVREAIFDGVRLLKAFPQMGRQQKPEGVRKLVTRRYHYLIYYTFDVAADEVVVLTIQHPARERKHDDG